MKFQWIGTGQVFARMAILSLLLLAGARSASAADEELPAPAAAEAPAPATNNPLPAAKAATDNAALTEDENIPAPSLGDDALPEPAVDRGQEKAHNEVNKAPDSDDIFLPTPNVNDNAYYAPVGSGSSHVSADDMDWHAVTQSRPAFSLYGGGAVKSYANTNVKQNFTSGYFIGASYRLFSLGQTLSLHAFYGFSAYGVGDVGSVANVEDNTQQIGGFLDLALGRRFSLSTSLYRRQANIRATTLNPQLQGTENLADVNNIGEQPEWLLGVGAQWDFYVIPHGSVGLNLHLERDLYSLTLAFAMEPAPRKKLNLNYGDMETE